MSATSRLQRPPAFVACAVLAAALAVCRTLVPVLYEQFSFDSDQAIVGLMAKHLSEGRGFPLFFYGQHYMLGVQSWIAVPAFWLGGPTVAMLRLPLVVLYATAAVGFVAAGVRAGLRPAWALVAVLPLAAATPALSTALLETLGASVEPFVYLVALWWLRRRPAAFGAVWMVATLHREFSLFALPAALVAAWSERRPWRAREVVRCAAAAASVWVAIGLLKSGISTFGPGDAGHATTSLVAQAQTIGSWLGFDPGPYLARVRAAGTAGLADLLGMRAVPLSRYGANSALVVGSFWAGALVFAAAALAAASLLWRGRRGGLNRPGTDGWAIYLAVVGLLTVAAYGLNTGIDAGAPVVIRYVLFAVLVPIALFTACFGSGAPRALRLAVAAAVVAWSGFTTVDHLRLAAEYRHAPPPSHFRAAADALVGRGIRYGRAPYWDAYAITFLAQERLRLATSSGKVRIASYQRIVEAHAGEAVTLQRIPCEGGVRMAAWCVTR